MRSANCSFTELSTSTTSLRVVSFGGPTWDRTRDLTLIRGLLCRLSYGPSQALDKAFELLAPTGMPQFSQGLCLDLPDPFPGHFKVLPDLFQRMVCILPDPKPLSEYFLFTRGKRLQDVFDLSL